MESAIVAFKLLGIEIIQNGLNILLQQMQLIVYPTFIVGGFRNWKKVGDKDCYFQGNIGKDPNSGHRVAEQMCKD